MQNKQIIYYGNQEKGIVDISEYFAKGAIDIESMRAFELTYAEPVGQLLLILEGEKSDFS